MLSRADFSPVTQEDRPLFVSHYQRFPPVHSDNTFTNMVCWEEYAHYRFAHVHDSIIISSTIDGRTKFRPPIGPHDPELLEDLLALCLQEGGRCAARPGGCRSAGTNWAAVSGSPPAS